MQQCIVIYMTGGQPTETTSNEEQELQYYYPFFMLLFLSSISCNVLNYTFPVMEISNANFYITYLDKISFCNASIYWINYILSISYFEKELAFYHIDIKGYLKCGPYNITKLYIIFLLIYVIINKDFADFMRTNYSNIYKLPSSHTFACNIVVAFARWRV